MPEPIISYNPLNDYRIILDMPPAAKTKITAVKEAFDLDYKGLPVHGGQTFIYLAEFSERESKEQELTDLLNRIALGFMPFKLHLKNFGQLDGREIYIGIENEKPIQLLTEQIEDTGKMPSGIRLNRLPRVTVARGLQPFQFVKSWKEYEKKSFSATFVANKMLLLKRMEGFSHWQILRELEFQNLVMVP